jgi:hypothetical protein
MPSRKVRSKSTVIGVAVVVAMALLAVTTSFASAKGFYFYTWLWDTVPPQTILSSGPKTGTTATSARFAFTSNEAGSFTCQLDGGGWSSCIPAMSYSGLKVGSHTFSVRARDLSGNVDSSPAMQTWTVTAPPPPADTIPPDTAITSGSAVSTISTSASFTLAATEANSSFACKLDSGSWVPCASSQTYSGLAIGRHSFSVRATDSAGNMDASPATRTWTVEAPAPAE